jgi:hypothetical protein
MAGETFTQARATVSEVERFVTSKLDELGSLASSYATSATDTAQGLANLIFQRPEDPPEIPEIEFDLWDLEVLELQDIDATTFGLLTATIPDAPTYSPVSVSPSFAVPEFVTTMVFNPPLPPVLDTFTAPIAPTTAEVTIPGAPALERPIIAELTQIVIPEFTFAPIADFAAALPEFEGATPVTTLQWTEPVYAPEILDEVLAQLRAFWSGDTGLPEAVEQAMWERMASREDLALARQIADVATEFSARGFTTPPGMQVARVDAMREDGIIKKLGASREVAIEVAKAWVGYDKLIFVFRQRVGKIELKCKASLRCRGLVWGRAHDPTLHLDQ